MNNSTPTSRLAEAAAIIGQEADTTVNATDGQTFHAIHSQTEARWDDTLRMWVFTTDTVGGSETVTYGPASMTALSIASTVVMLLGL